MSTQNFNNPERRNIIIKYQETAIKAEFEKMANACQTCYADLKDGCGNSATFRFCVESAIECIEASLTDLAACLAEY